MKYEDEALFPDGTEIRDTDWHYSKGASFESNRIPQRMSFIIESNHDQPIRCKIQASLHSDFSRPFDVGPEGDKEFVVAASPGAGAYSEPAYETLQDFFQYMRVAMKADIAPTTGDLGFHQVALSD